MAACAAAAIAALRSAPACADSTIYEYQFTNYSFNPTTVATDLVGAPFSYVNANPGNPPFNNPAFIVAGGTLPDDPAFFVGQGDWFPTSLGYNSNYYTAGVSVQPGFALNVNTLSFVANSRQQVLFDMQVAYSNNASFSSPTNFDTNQFLIPTTENWNPFAATDAPISNGIATYYFRLNGTLDPNSNGSISDLLNVGNVSLIGSIVPYAGVTPMYWDPGKIGSPGSGGTGTWLASNTWADGVPDYSWSDPTISESANFAGTAGGVVALGGSVSALHNISFLTSGYNITGMAGQTLTVAGTITTNGDATISAVLATTGIGTLTKAGTASLTVAGSAAFSQGTSLAITAGRLKLVNNIAPQGTNTIAAGAVLEFDSSGRTLQSPTTFTGSGTLRVTSDNGLGDFTFGGFGAVNINLSPGALIDIESGKLTGSSSFGGDWDANFASLNVATGAMFNIVEGGLTGTMHIDALTGGGQFLGGYQFNNGSLTTVTIGDANGSGVFSGTLGDNTAARLGIVKTGTGAQTFSGSNTYTGGTTINAGILNITGNNSLPSGMPVVNNSTLGVYAINTVGRITGSGKLNIGATGTAGALKIASGSGTSTLGALSIAAGSVLDVTNTTVLIPFGAPANDPVATIANALTGGYNAGRWTGTGINSSTAAGNPATLAVGYDDGNTDLGTAAAPNQILIKYTLAGDTNLDGLVNFNDLVVVVQNFNKAGTDWAHGNFAYGASTNFNDLVAVVQNFNKVLTPAGSSGDELGVTPAPLGLDAQLPEPGDLIFMASPLSLLFCRRHKNPRNIMSNEKECS